MTRLCAVGLAFCLISFVSACPDETDGDSDADSDVGADGDGDLDIPLPEPPVAPELTPCPEGWEEVPPVEEGDAAICAPWPEGIPVVPPALTPCPLGWREVLPGIPEGPTTCDPWPVDGRQECADDEAHFPGETECTQIGTTCPAGDWAEDFPSDAHVLYVKSGAPLHGDGSQDAPLGTIAEAMTRATEGTIIALGKGAFDEEVRLRRGVTLWGACVDATRVTCSEPADWVGTISIEGSDAVVRNLTVTGERPGVSVDGDVVGAHLEDVLIEESILAGWIFSFGGHASGSSVVVRETRSHGSGQLGVGLVMDNGAQVEVSRAVFEGNRDSGIWISGAGSTLSLADTALSDTESDGSGSYGRGLTIWGGAQVVASRVAIERNRDMGVEITGEGSLLHLTDGVVSDTQNPSSPGNGDTGYGVQVSSGAHAEVQKVSFNRNLSAGVLVGLREDTVGDPETAVTLMDVVVLDTQGAGLHVENGTRMDVTRASLERNHTVGVSAVGAETVLLLTDIAVRDTRISSTGEFGNGLEVTTGASVEAERALFERNHYSGITVSSPNTNASLEDIVVRDTELNDVDMYCVGLQAEDGAHVVLARASFERNHQHGIIAINAGTTLTMSDVVVHDTRSDSNGDFGFALAVDAGAEVAATRSSFVQNRYVGVFVTGLDATATLSDVVVRDTVSDDNGEGGRGLAIQDGAEVQILRAAFERNMDASLSVFDEGSFLSLSDVVVSDTESDTDGDFGTGLMAYHGAEIEVSRAVFLRNRYVSIFAVSDGTRVTMNEVSVLETRERCCAQDTCSGQGGGHGFASRDQALIDVTGFLISRSALCGVQVALDGGVELHDGWITDNPIGANIQIEEFDWDRQLDGVVFQDNERDFDTMQLPIPDTALPIDWLSEGNP